MSAGGGDRAVGRCFRIGGCLKPGECLCDHDWCRCNCPECRDRRAHPEDYREDHAMTAGDEGEAIRRRVERWFEDLGLLEVLQPDDVSDMHAYLVKDVEALLRESAVLPPREPQETACIYGTPQPAPCFYGTVGESATPRLASPGAEALRAALVGLVDDLEARWDMSDPRTNPGIKHHVQQAKEAIAKYAALGQAEARAPQGWPWEPDEQLVVAISRDEDGDYIARDVTRNGCITHDATELGALTKLLDVRPIYDWELYT
jgi:hypothetical protein